MGLGRFLRRAKWDRDRLAEIESYVQIATDENIARGMSPDAARAAARKKLGNKTHVVEEIYRMNTLSWLDTPIRTVRHTLRGLRRNPMFTVVALLTLAIGIGANTAVFSVVNSVLLKPLPYPQPETLITVAHSAVFQGTPTNNVSLSPRLFVTYLDNNRTFEKFGVWTERQASVTGAGNPEQVDSLVVTQGFLAVLGVQPAFGRWFSQADDTPGSPETVILTHGYWQRRLSGDSLVLGRTITVNSRPMQIIGVMPQSFRFHNSNAQLILPQRFERSRLASNFGYRGIARLKPGATLTNATADVARMLPIWIAGDPGNRRAWEALNPKPALRPVKQDVVGNVGQVLWILMGTIGVVLLIACANVANLLLVRAEGRQQELAIRAALGAGWGRIARELLVESFTLGVLGGALGLALANAGLRLLVTIGPASLPRLDEISIDPTVLAFALGASLFSGLLFGLIPVLKYAGPRISTTLRAGGRALSQSRERHRSQNALVVVQVALALLLLVGSGLMIRSFQAMRNVQPGFTRPEQIQTVRISIPPALVQENELVARMQHDILDKLAAIPGVTSAAFSTALPMEVEPEFESSNVISAEETSVEGQMAPLRRVKTVSPNSFQTVGTPLLAGRDFTWSDINENLEVVIVSENLARETWGRASAALGKRLREAPRGPWREVVGVVADVYDDGAHQPAVPLVYWPARAEANPTIRSVGFAIRSSRAATESLLNEVRGAVWSVNADLPLSRVQTLGEIYDQSMARTSFTLVMLAIVGSMALLLGIIGIYGVIAYMVSQRRREIGIRLALGAQQGELQKMFVRHGLVLASIGVAIGLAAATGLTRLMSSLLFGVSPLDPVTFGGVALFLAAAAALASYLPARQASAVDPLEAMRTE